MAPTLKSNRKVGSKSSSSAKSKDIAYGGGGLDFGLDYSKVKVDANYVPGPIFNEEEAEQEDMDQVERKKKQKDGDKNIVFPISFLCCSRQSLSFLP